MLLRVLAALALFSAANAQAPTFGLPDNGLRKLSIHLGVLPDWSHEGPIEINKALGGGVGIIGELGDLARLLQGLTRVA